MAALSGNQRAYLTARCGSARSGGVRSAFTPKDTKNQAPGTSGPYYLWARVYQTAAEAVSWTAVKR